MKENGTATLTTSVRQSKNIPFYCINRTVLSEMSNNVDYSLLTFKIKIPYLFELLT